MLLKVVKEGLSEIASTKKKSLDKSWKSIISSDKTLPGQVIKVMSTLKIIEKDKKIIKIFEERLQELMQIDFDIKDFIKKVKEINQ